MNTPQTITRFSACSFGITPSATESATALATAAWAGPNICTACFMPLIVTLVIITVAGLTARFGVSTASRFEWPSLCRARALANATPTGPSLLADQQVDMGDFVAFAGQGFADEHAHPRDSLGRSGLA